MVQSGRNQSARFPRSLKQVTDRRGLVTEYQYDERGNVTNQTVRGDLLGDGDTNTVATQRAVFNAQNLPLRIETARGTTNWFYYTNTWLLSGVSQWGLNATTAEAITNGYNITTSPTR